MNSNIAQRQVLAWLNQHGRTPWNDLATNVARTLTGTPPEQIRSLTDALNQLERMQIIITDHKYYDLSAVGKKAFEKTNQKITDSFPLEYIEPFAVRLRSQILQMERVINVQIAGSIRRRKERCRDIELVALLRPPELLREQQCPHEALRARALTVHKSGDKYTQVTIKAPDPLSQVKIDLFTTEDPAQWGALFAIRTGSADFIQRGLAHWKKITDGGYCKNNRLHQADGTQENTATEDLFFAALGCRRTPKPEERS